MPFKEKVCLDCETVFSPTSGAQKRCPACGDSYRRRCMKAYYQAHYVQKGEYKWEMPKGKASPSYKSGIGAFVQIAFDNYPHECARCKSEEHLCVHHRDRNRKHNEVENLEILCKSCHQKEHKAAAHLFTADVRAKTREAASAYQLAHPAEHDSLGRFTTKKA